MKPRLEPCDHTPEDSLAWSGVIWLANRGSGYTGSYLWTRSLMQDRRDADLMLDAQMWKFRGVAYIANVIGTAGELVPCRGRPVDFWGTGVDIT